MHGKAEHPYIKGTQKCALMVGGRPMLEYEGLKSGELCWILGRRFKAGGTSLELEGSRYASQANMGIGNGVDRMQRLASTSWVEALIEDKLSTATVELHDIDLGNPHVSKEITAMVGNYAKYLLRSTPLFVPDIAYEHTQIEGSDASKRAAASKKRQGIDLMETGPFLRGIQVDTNIVRYKDSVANLVGPVDFARNIGDSIAFAAIETELRRKNLMDWTPDGIVLSKLESPTDDPAKSTEIDARSAQLFNVGVQGPAITTSWTSDVRDYQLEVQPMDRVFICLVARLSYTMSTTAANASYDDIVAGQEAVFLALKNYNDAYKKNMGVAAADAALQTAVGKLKVVQKFGEAALGADPTSIKLEKDYSMAKAALKEAVAKDAKVDHSAKEKAVTDAQTALNDATPKLTETERNQFNTKRDLYRKGSTVPKKAILTNFRLIRSTSAHMANYSFYDPENPNSRLKLPINTTKDIKDSSNTTVGFEGSADYIVGAWCIGTVMDSAATRSTIGTSVRTAPTSMAINLNVNVQWWSGDRLYKAFMDASGSVAMRGRTRKRTLDKADKDMDQV